MIQDVALVSCVGKKLARPGLARELYQSTWFHKAHAYVEKMDYEWYILSAKYGLVHPCATIEPYEQVLKSLPAARRKDWAQQVYKELNQLLPESSRVWIFAGKHYREHLVPQLEADGFVVEIPLARLGIGQQLAWFDSQLLPP